MGAWKEAFGLSKAQLAEAKPPGTVEIVDHHHEIHGISRFPKPSQDPRDPLNFSQTRKVTALVMVSVFAFVSNFAGSVIAPALQLWPVTFPHDPQSFSSLTHLIAVHVLFLGASNIWWVPLGNWAGRRPVLIAATLLMTLCSVWGAVTTSYGSLLAARLFQGAGGGAADTVAPAMVGELFFIHERGRGMAVYTASLCLGPIVGSLTGGYIAFAYGWAMPFWITTALSGFCFLGVVFFVPETLFERQIEQEHSSDSAVEQSSEIKLDPNDDAVAVHVESQTQRHAELGYVQSLGFIRPRGDLLQLFIRPWRTLALPATWVVTLHYGGLVGGFVTISTIGPQLVAVPPYLWGSNVGLISVGGLVGAACGFIYTYLLADRRLQKEKNVRKSGIAEAEDRLPTLIVPLTVATCGFFVYGFCGNYPGGKKWVGLEVGFAMISFGLMQVPSIGFNYLIDSYLFLAADCFTIATILRSVISFAWTFFVAEWIAKSGTAEAFGIFGMLMGIFSLLTIPLWLYGKRIRIATSKMITA